MNPVAQQFRRDAAAKAGDLNHRATVQRNIGLYDAQVTTGKKRFADWAEGRARLAQIKWDVVNHLDRYLEQFERNVIDGGGQVHWAETGEQAVQIILDLARHRGVRKVVKAKSMTTEEIHLLPALEAAGIKAVETDLGEYICQLRDEPPYHIVTPVMHLSRQDVSRTFEEKLGTPPTDSAEELTMIARRQLRQEFLTADMGVTGANFAVAETGQIALTENEGNIRLSFSLPRVHVAVLGIEKLVPRVEDLVLFWPMLATSGTGQAVTGTNSLVAGSRRDGEPDGPEEFHVVLLDNGRSRLLADVEQRDALHCIRCGACLNACPVYRTIGGHAYHTTYMGPIGAVITPHLRGARDWSHLPYASSLCGACTEVCPVNIPVHRHLLHNRRNAAGANRWQRLAFRVWLWGVQSAARYRLGGALIRWCVRRGWPAPPWTNTRELPVAPAQSFRDWWKTQ
jgi:L-lactate dehydrogenase complex protein LldF